MVLRIRGSTGVQSLLLHMEKDDTIGQLRRFVDRHRGRGKNYELRTQNPPRKYDNLEETLEEAGLSPVAVIMLVDTTS